jgi:hypothetical protein
MNLYSAKNNIDLFTKRNIVKVKKKSLLNMSEDVQNINQVKPVAFKQLDEVAVVKKIKIYRGNLEIAKKIYGLPDECFEFLTEEEERAMKLKSSMAELVSEQGIYR